MKQPLHEKAAMKYAVFSERPEESFHGTAISGDQCSCRRHFFYLLDLTDHELTAVANAPWGGRGGRKSVADSFWASNSSCYIERDGKRIYSTIDRATGMIPPVSGDDEGEAIFEPLGDAHRAYLCDEIMRHVSSASRDAIHERLSRYFLDVLLWCWTADGVHTASGQAHRDALKYSFEHLPHTRAAHRHYHRLGSASGLRHEHVVPRKVLLEHLLGHKPDRNEIAKLLSQYCRAAIVTVGEDARLSGGLRSNMPGRRFEPPTTSWLARYEHIDLKLEEPGNCACLTAESPDGRPGGVE